MPRETELLHYGVPGMKWGVRRYQNKDGSLTRRGKKHKAAALKGLREERDEYLKKAEDRKVANAKDASALKQVKANTNMDPEVKKRAIQSLTDDYRRSGQEYVNAMYRATIYDEYVKAYDNDTLKVGQDYVAKNVKKGIIQLTDSGIYKESSIIDKMTPKFNKKYAKDFKRFS